LTLEGWKRIAELSKTQSASDQAFVAMWFDRSLNAAWSLGFKPALIDCGYMPIRIDLQEHNEKICDRIVSEIRKSGLLIADFTGQRGGVYFESGFALGLGVPVIWTCRSDDVSNLHFDTRQYNHIVWDKPDDLKEKLTNRINATLPYRPTRNGRTH
jgi:nucleoside 2-deoxyribosyltransferase